MERKIPVRGLLSVETEIALDRLSQAVPGEVIEYGELDKLCGCEVRKRRNILDTSMRRLLAEQGMVFVAEHGKGLRLLKNEEIPSVGFKDIARIGKISKRCARRLSAVDYDTLSAQSKIAHNTHLTVLSLFQRASTKSSLQKVGQAVADRTHPLPVGDTLRLFGTIKD